MRNKRLLFLTTCLLIVGTFNGCTVFQASGDTLEAIGEGAGIALVGLASGTGYAVAGTGRAISTAARNTPQSIQNFSGESYSAPVRPQQPSDVPGGW